MGQQLRRRVRSAAGGARCHRGQRPNGAHAGGNQGVPRRISGGGQAPIPDDAQRGGRPRLHLVVGRVIIKPLCGAKGRNVFMVDGEDEPNLNQMMEAVLEDGYIYAQGYVEGAEEGDMRIFLLDGELIEVDGHISAFRRVPEGNDPRANISAGGRMQPGDITEKQRAVVKAMHDKLVQDGMFFVGIDVIGDKVIEINTESPGGLQAIEHLYGVDICPIVIDALETPEYRPDPSARDRAAQILGRCADALEEQLRRAASLRPFSVELPGIDPVSASWSQSRTGTDLRNDISCDSPELTSADTECAQNVPQPVPCVTAQAEFGVAVGSPSSCLGGGPTAIRGPRLPAGCPPIGGHRVHPVCGPVGGQTRPVSAARRYVAGTNR